MAPVPLIIDTDPGVDDVLAILLALASPAEADVKAITLTFGNTTLDYAYSNVLRVAGVLHSHPELLGRFGAFASDASPILLASGADKPLGGRLFTAAYFHGRDGLSGVHSLPDDPFPAPETPPHPLVATDRDAADVILDTLRDHPPGTVRIAALGPLTNLAIAFERDPETFARVGPVSIMGGALDVPGNTTPVAEFNFFADPWAVKTLTEIAPTRLGRRLPLYIIPLDITSTHVVPYSRLIRPPNSKLEAFIAAFLSHPRSVVNGYAAPEDFNPDIHDLFEAHDPLAVAHALFHTSDSNWKHETRSFRIETDGQLTRGFCIVE